MANIEVLYKFVRYLAIVMATILLILTYASLLYGATIDKVHILAYVTFSAISLIATAIWLCMFYIVYIGNHLEQHLEQKEKV
ncbi:MAG: hypothetical protein QXQ19_00450 [Candidatus Aenigmatarchaeota archaeon]